MGTREQAIKNLKKKGAEANPNGRPKREWTIAGLIEEALEEEDVDGVPFKKKLTHKLRTLALRGDMNAIKEVHQRLDGMPKQPITGGDEDDRPLQIDITSTIKKVYGQGNITSSGGVSEDS